MICLLVAEPFPVTVFVQGCCDRTWTCFHIQEHIKLGEALAPLQDEGIMIIGSGMSYHSMQGFAIRGRGDPESANADSQVRGL